MSVRSRFVFTCVRQMTIFLIICTGIACASAPAKADCGQDRAKLTQLFGGLPENRKDAFTATFLHFTLVDRQQGKSVILIWGGVCSGDARSVRRVLDANAPIGEVLFYSPGGDLDEGLEIGRIIRRAKIATRIPAGFACYSACNFMFMGGVIREIEPGGVFGVHMFATSVSSRDARTIVDIINSRRALRDYLDDHPEKKVTDEQFSAAVFDQAEKIYSDRVKEIQQDAAQYSAQIARFLVEMQLSLRFLTEFANIPNSEPRELTRDELRDYNVTNTD